MKELHYNEDKQARLDSYLLGLFPMLKSGTLHKAARKNQIKVNGKKQPLSTRLQAGDLITLYLPDVAFTPPPLEVLFEDDGLLAVYKPAALASLGEGDTATSRATAYLGKPALPCHRLDTGTSGILLFAKNEATLRGMEELQAAHTLRKSYVCVTVGAIQPASGQLTGWLTKDAKQGRVKLHPKRIPGAKKAVLQYKTLYTSGELALLEVELITGRTHQIRAQLAAAGTPVLGDSKYGTLAANRAWGCKAQCLCAIEIQFPAIENGPLAAYSRLAIKCPAPWYYTQMLAGGLERKKP